MLASPLGFLPSLDHLIRPREKFRRECQSDLFRSFQIDHELKLCRLLHRQINRFDTFQDLIHVNSRAPIEVIEVRSKIDRVYFEDSYYLGPRDAATVISHPLLFSSSMAWSTDVPSLVLDFYATTPFDFFSATYFLIARRLFCLLRLCEFFRASCFMLILLVRRDCDGSSATKR
jgi:hypothetical protein